MEKEKEWKNSKSISPDEFEFETRFIVLNFLGLVPASSPGLNVSRGSSSNDSAAEGRPSDVKEPKSSDSSHLKTVLLENGNKCSLKEVLPNLPEMSLNDKIKQHEESTRVPEFGVAHDKKKEEVHGEDPLQESDKLFSHKRHESSDDEIVIEVKSADDDLEEIYRPAGISRNTTKEKLNNVHASSHSNGDLNKQGSYFPSGGTLFHPAGKNTSVDESGDNVDFVNARDSKQRHAERPTSLNDLVPSVAPARPVLRYEKSKSPRRSQNLTRTPTLDSDKSEILNDKSPRVVKRLNSQKSPKPGLFRELSSSSNVTDLSEIDSLMLTVSSHGSRNTSAVYVDICHIEKEALEKNKALPEVLHLKKELEEEFAELGKHSEKQSGDENVQPPPPLSKSSRSMSSLSPESKVAQYLSRIGDSVQDKYGLELDRAFQTVVSHPDEMDFNVMSEVAGSLTENTSGWTKVALVMLLGKKLAFGLLSSGAKGNVIHNVADYTTKILEDQVAGFIIDKGGWNSIQDLDDSESYSSEYSPQVSEYSESQLPPLIQPGVENSTFKSNNESDDSAQKSPEGISEVMTTSLHSNDSTIRSDCSTVVVNSNTSAANDQGFQDISRDTSNDTIPSLLYSPDNLTKSNGFKNPELSVIGKGERLDSVSSLHHGGASVKSFGFVVDSDCEDEMEAFDSGDNLERQQSYSSDNYSAVEGTLDAEFAIENLQRELTLLRQVSNQYSEESERKKKLIDKKIAWGLLLGALGSFTLFCVLKYVHKQK